ncbi:hypothetical protein Pta02_39030 [Planobispora takensis]|uniref:Uncharacterized protein n=1 Tax=Planobispora takensis TaxID=1367882 RepID=A0A8J3SYZ6_9ACTN|nr:hypothetical protein Pta02_39030 [Planobispora takensis]
MPAHDPQVIHPWPVALGPVLAAAAGPPVATRDSARGRVAAIAVIFAGRGRALFMAWNS